MTYFGNYFHRCDNLNSKNKVGFIRSRSNHQSMNDSNHFWFRSFE